MAVLPAPRPRICGHAIEWSAICGIQRHLPAWRTRRGRGSKARGGPKAHIPLLKEKCRKGTCPFLPPQLQRGKGPPSVQLLSPP